MSRWCIALALALAGSVSAAAYSPFSFSGSPLLISLIDVEESGTLPGGVGPEAVVPREVDDPVGDGLMPDFGEYWLFMFGGVPLDMGGSGFQGEWIYYPETNWWNMWWPNEFAFDRPKEITISFFLDMPPGTAVVVAFNWSTPDWTDPGRPPLAFEEPFIIREEVGMFFEPGEYTFTTMVPYCPAWVSIDVQGTDFYINGTIVHECLPPGGNGACCLGPDCYETTEDECIAMGGIFYPGLDCFPNPCNPPEYWLRLDNGTVIEQGGTGFGGQWYYYYETNWWNMWWPNEFALDRPKEITITLEVDLPPTGDVVIVAFNWSSPEWQDPGAPPMPTDEMYIMREEVGFITAPGTYTFTTLVPYCPAWVSVDVMGQSFAVQGFIDHVCLPSGLMGACCYGPDCVMTTEDECIVTGGVYQGDGTDCFPNPCNPPEYWLRLENGDPVEQGGTGFNGQWYYYFQTGWWNMWWPNEFALDRPKEITLTFDLDMPAGTAVVVAFNWSTPDWGDSSMPPMPSDEPFIIREEAGVFTTPGTYSVTTLVPYCPAWVSVDVMGDFFAIQGFIDHICLPPVPRGACCYGPDCVLTTAEECMTTGGVYQGDGTDCFPNPCNPPEYWLRLDNGEPVEQGGTGFGGQWYYYYETNWWNMWWPNEFALDRPKQITLTFELDMPPGEFVVVAYNWSTPDWQDPGAPPMPMDEPFIMREEAGIFTAPGTYSFTTLIPYCPAWVSVDVMGQSFAIQGFIDHVCLGPPPEGACCHGPICTIETQAECESTGGIYMGDGTDCFPNPCIPPLDYWLRLEGGMPVEQGGTGFAGEWFFYDQTGWWNMWWWNEFDTYRRKVVTLVFDVESPPGLPPPIVAFNWSTPAWPDPGMPPMPPDEPFIVREVAGVFPEPGLYTVTTSIPYCPWWVSVDVMGEFLEIQGNIDHVCIPWCPGDMNCDCVRDFKDINPFVLALSAPGAWQAAFPGCNIMNGDVNGDGAVDFKDINPFVVVIVAGGPCPEPCIPAP